MKKIVLLRHGESAWNKENRFTGWTDVDLTEKGIARDRLYKEDRSTSTRENLLYSKKIIEEKNLDPQVIIVTNEFHEYRASVIAEHTGIKPSAVCGKTAWWLLPTYYLRELYGIVFEWIF